LKKEKRKDEARLVKTVEGGFIVLFLFSAEQRPHVLFYICTAETNCCFWSEVFLFHDI